MSEKVRVAAARGLNVRARPTVASRRVGALPFGTVVTVHERRGAWGGVLAPLVGWIHLGYTVPAESTPGTWLEQEAVDLSKWNRVTELFWHSARPWVLILKATQGMLILDPRFGERWARARFEGWPVWAYHFYDPRYPGYAQAAVFLRTTGLRDDERAVLDLEWHPPEGKSSWAGREVLEFVRAIEEVTGKPPVIYTRRDVWMAYFGDSEDAWAEEHGWPLWVADHRDHRPVSAPLAVPGWNRWALWQYTHTGQWPGVAGHVDRSRVAKWFAEGERERATSD